MRSYDVAKGISYTFNVFFMSVCAFAILTYGGLVASSIQNVVFLTAAIFSAGIPFGLLLLYMKRNDIKDFDLPDRINRDRIFMISIFSYMVGVLVLMLLGTNSLLVALMFCYATNTASVMITNLFWKISVHMVGITGPWVAIFYFSPFVGVILLPLVLVVGWSRYRLDAHTRNQIIAGALLGWILTFSQFHILLNYVLV